MKTNYKINLEIGWRLIKWHIKKILERPQRQSFTVSSLIKLSVFKVKHDFDHSYLLNFCFKNYESEIKTQIINK